MTASLRCRRNLNSVSNVCDAALISLFRPPNGLNEFPFILIDQSAMAFLTGQSGHAIKSGYTGGDPEQGCFANGLNQSLISAAAQVI